MRQCAVLMLNEKDDVHIVSCGVGVCTIREPWGGSGYLESCVVEVSTQLWGGSVYSESCGFGVSTQL